MYSLQDSPHYPCFPLNTDSLANRYLTKDIYDRLINLKTKYGFKLFDAIRSGIQNQDSLIGIYAGDAESYNLFSAIFKPIIENYHDIKPLPSSLCITSITTSFFTPNLTAIDLPDPDPEHQYILSTRIRVARNLAGFPFTPIMSPIDRKHIEEIIIEAIQYMHFPLKGNYYSLQASPIQSCFRKGDRFQEAAGINRDWPDSRGVFESDDNRFLVWINEEDHLRIISIDRTGDISGVFNRLIRIANALGNNLNFKNINFAWSTDLGYLTTCPSNLGTAMRAGVHIKLPKLFKHRVLLENAAKQLKLQIRGTNGEKTDIESSIFDISNSQRLGLTEQDCCITLHNGISRIIELEQQL